MENIVPREKWLYNDRGMMKWMGWLLSDHSAYMDEEKIKERKQPQHTQMKSGQISERLNNSWLHANEVLIQVNVLEDDYLIPEFKGIVAGFGSGQIYLQLDNSEFKILQVEQIRWIGSVKDGKWWDDEYPL